LLETKAVFL